MRLDPKAEGLRWLEQAEQDLADARYLLTGKRYHLVCFLAQQAAEKAVKGFLYAQGLEWVRGHSVADLARAAAEFNASFKALVPVGGNLDRHYVPTRYPNALPGGIPSQAFDIEDAQKALEQAQHILNFVHPMIES
ncbi:MAG: HEPN domain-containing protein [Chloroflexota bacterium]|nr:HEPN domain-containing protein [Chloroflexota bacterium]